MDDVRAIMDAIGSNNTVGEFEGADERTVRRYLPERV
jgi:hypothetical protein